ncbi:hypothetical protein WR164_15490 [Philodulcilactobacillus myokoensis]|uniref:Lactococcin 972 family bacteriocin n=1 Tax=Philodulcilactobacillus myokoensis TaxID=2929573 RepID=A0A9W6ETC1_9LACO|nr:hypothetical protein [Philodulcilactobacillus myokoensis]GLB47570.1 hypothetical protein WR164_15490 [Philodulcilactobacillus myokoensis]
MKKKHSKLKFLISLTAGLALFSTSIVNASAKRVRVSYDYDRNDYTGSMSHFTHVKWMNVGKHAHVVDHFDKRIKGGGWNYKKYSRHNIRNETN